MDRISIEDIYSIAQLAALELSPEEAEQFRIHIEGVSERSLPLLDLLKEKSQRVPDIPEEDFFHHLRTGEPITLPCLLQESPLTIAGLICSPPVLQNEQQ